MHPQLDTCHSQAARRHRMWQLAAFAAPALLLPFTALGGSAIASAAPSAASTHVCSGTSGSPGTLAGGTYAAVEISGVCDVDAGQAVVTGNLTVDPGGALVAAFVHNDHHPGTSGLTVHGNILVSTGATLVLGCGPQDSPCLDDGTQTLTSPGIVGGSVLATNPLGVLVHDSKIAGDAVQSGGGGGVNCTPTGIFASLIHAPVFSDYEDSTIGGNIWVTGLHSCWLGALRNQVGGSITFAHNVMADPDAMEILTNHVRGNVVCVGNSPANQYGDSHGMPNIVSGFGAGQCAFSVKVPDPLEPGSPPGPLTPISVPASQTPGYDLGGTDGGLFTFGPPFFGSAAGMTPAPFVGLATPPGGLGYWLTTGGGLIANFGPNGRSFGSAAGLPLVQPIVGIAAAPGGDGYWQVAGDGGIFPYGPGAPFFGSAGTVRLAKPIVGMAAAPTGDGYDLVGADGGVLTYGPGAHFHGSLGGTRLNSSIVGMAIDPSTGGYWLVGGDGGVFSFHTPFYGSLAGSHLNAPIVGIAAAPTGNGYYLIGADGGVFTEGPGAHFHGSLGGSHLNAPIDGIALG